MGVTATGKSTVAQALAEQLDVELIEGDDYHSPANVEKMEHGNPLTDEDRLPWLRTLAGLIAEHDAQGSTILLACSALRRTYRDILRSGVPEHAPLFLHLHADFDVLLGRMRHRQRHFMPASLLQSQFDTLEPLEPDESGSVVDVAQPLPAVVAEALHAVRAHAAR